MSNSMEHIAIEKNRRFYMYCINFFKALSPLTVFYHFNPCPLGDGVRGKPKPGNLKFKTAFMALAFSLALLPGAGIAATIDLPQTGQTTCYNTIGSVIDCADTGQDAEMKGGAPWPDDRFTDNSDGTMTDNLTRLIWLKNANCADGTRTWTFALAGVDSLNSSGMMGSNDCGDVSNVGSHQTDWRLPNVNELESMVSAQMNSVTWLTNTEGFLNVKLSFYWSATTYDPAPADAWVVYLGGGSVLNNDKLATGYVWPVRAGD